MDYLIFSAATLLVFALLHRVGWKGYRSKAAPVILWLSVVSILGAGWFLIAASGQREEHRMRQAVDGLAPTYAQEVGLLGHEEITPETSPDSPRYWKIISAQKRWLKANPALHDIQTVRRLANGQIVYIVDSETDADGNGRIEGAVEQRTRIGKRYNGPLAEQITAVLGGQPYSPSSPSTTEQGTWISGLAPIRNFRGDTEAMLIVEVDAAPWLAAAKAARLYTMGYLAALLLAIAIVSIRPASLQTKQDPLGPAQEVAPVRYVLSVREELPTPAPESSPAPVATLSPAAAVAPSPAPASQPDAISLEKDTLETLINSVDGIVWEADPRRQQFSFVSRQCEAILGYPPEVWKAAPDFWKSRLHPDDQSTYDQCTRTTAVPSSCEYRMMAADGRTVWIRESAAALLDENGAPRVVHGVYYDITAQKHAAEELEQAHRNLVESSRHAGMAEVATGVLHNVGNVLNSVNISGSVISERLRTSKVIELGKVAGLLTLQKADFVSFVARDPRGPHIPELISLVTDALRAEHADLLEEVESITRNISHIKEIVAMQQGFAKGAGIVEALNITSVVDDAIKINSIQMSKQRINVVQAYEEVPRVVADKHLVLQILVNLLRNAQQAIESYDGPERRIVVKVQPSATGSVRIAVQDSGSGIAPENLTRIFSHGFTTKKTGHGFGLHSSALAATGMGGALSVHSEGLGTGATFYLELTADQPAQSAEPALSVAA